MQRQNIFRLKSKNMSLEALRFKLQEDKGEERKKEKRRKRNKTKTICQNKTRKKTKRKENKNLKSRLCAKSVDVLLLLSIVL